MHLFEYKDIDEYLELEFPKLLELASEHNDATAQHLVGHIYYSGRDTKQNYSEAFKWYCKAERNGCAYSKIGLGLCYRNGYGVAQSDLQAFRYFCEAEDLGLVNGKTYLGECYLNGIGCQRDAHKAFQYFIEADSLGSVQAKNNLALCYENGWGVGRDINVAYRLYRDAAELNLPEAKYRIGLWTLCGTPTEQNKSWAFTYFEEAAREGYVPAITSLGLCYFHGTGVNPDQDRAFNYLKTAVERGSADAMVHLANCYLADPLLQDHSKVFPLLSAASKRNHPEAKYKLGELYLKGFVFEGELFDRDVKHAMLYFRQAEKLGYSPACMILGQMYESGIDVSKDFQRAASLYLKAGDELGASDSWDRLVNQCSYQRFESRKNKLRLVRSAHNPHLEIISPGHYIKFGLS